jgi:hypothetical protein
MWLGRRGRPASTPDLAESAEGAEQTHDAAPSAHDRRSCRVRVVTREKSAPGLRIFEPHAPFSDMNLGELQRWYERQCNGDWEHQYGVKIETLDNPGWTLTIDLVETELEHEAFAKVENLEPEGDWFTCSRDAGAFKGAGGPRQLDRLIETFLEWVRDVEARNPR